VAATPGPTVGLANAAPKILSSLDHRRKPAFAVFFELLNNWNLTLITDPQKAPVLMLDHGLCARFDWLSR
jgi:hypothetical protein